MQLRRKLTTAAVAGGALMASLAMTAPAHAIQWVACPTNGLTVETGNSDPDFCAAGTIGYKTIAQLTSNGKSQVTDVVKEFTNWNWAVFYNSTGYKKLKPGQSYYPGGVITYALEIDNPNFT